MTITGSIPDKDRRMIQVLEQLDAEGPSQLRVEMHEKTLRNVSRR